MSKVLNLDSIEATAQRVIKWKGNEYPMKSVTVREFVKMTQVLQAEAEAEKSEEEGMTEEQILSHRANKMIDMIAESYPTMPRDQIEQMSMEQLGAVLAFTRGENPLEAEAAEEGDAEKK